MIRCLPGTWISFATNTIAYRHGVWYIPEILHRYTVTGSNYSGGSSRWGRQETVLHRVFEVLQSPSWADVRGKFRSSAVLSFAPFILRYVVKHKAAREFLVPQLVVNSVLLAIFRRARSAVPQWMAEALIRLRSRHPTPI